MSIANCNALATRLVRSAGKTMDELNVIASGWHELEVVIVAR
jgi:hypothetical protein